MSDNWLPKYGHKCEAILSIMETRNRAVTAEEIAEELGFDQGLVRTYLGRLKNRDVVDRVGWGLYIYKVSRPC